ncbi:MAG: hypothetical protein K6D54_00440 [Bacteroidales bacterium]|nr:hypothetical protein [Bacteroidales bacterium]
MDVILLSKMIKTLIIDHDTVGLPGLGTFVAENIPASFSDRGYTINPPYRRLSFHSGRGEDGLLGEFYATSNGLSVSAADTLVRRFLGEVKDVLVERKTVVLPELGLLRATRDNTFFFVPDESLDIFPEGFGLEPISLKSHSRPVAENIVLDLRPKEAREQPQGMADQVGHDVPEPEPKPQGMADQVGHDVSETAPTHAPEPAPAPEPTPTPAPTPAPAPTPEPEAAKPARPARVRKKLHPAWITAISLVGAAAVFLAVFMILVKTQPALVDRLLYTPEELAIINY